jgi:hypothetical protein
VGSDDETVGERDVAQDEWADDVTIPLLAEVARWRLGDDSSGGERHRIIITSWRSRHLSDEYSRRQQGHRQGASTLGQSRAMMAGPLT